MLPNERKRTIADHTETFAQYAIGLLHHYVTDRLDFLVILANRCQIGWVKQRDVLLFFAEFPLTCTMSTHFAPGRDGRQLMCMRVA